MFRVSLTAGVLCMLDVGTRRGTCGIFSGSRSYFPLKQHGELRVFNHIGSKYLLHCTAAGVRYCPLRRHKRLLVAYLGHWPQEPPSFELHSISNPFQNPAHSTLPSYPDSGIG